MATSPIAFTAHATALADTAARPPMGELARVALLLHRGGATKVEFSNYAHGGGHFTAYFPAGLPAGAASSAAARVATEDSRTILAARKRRAGAATLLRTLGSHAAARRAWLLRLLGSRKAATPSSAATRSARRPATSAVLRHPQHRL